MIGRVAILITGVVALGILTIAPAALALTPAGQRLAFRAQAKLADLPAGWRTAKDDSKDDKPCLDVDQVAKRTGKSSRDFAKGDSAEVATSVAVYRSVSEARRVYAAVSAEKTWTCFGEYVKKHVSGAKEVKYGRYLLRGVGTRTNSHEILLTVESKGISATAHVHASLAIKGRALAYVVHTDVFSPALTLFEEAALMRRMVGRLP